MQLHTPQKVFAEHLDTTIACAGCDKRLLVREGVVYEGYYTQKEVQHWGFTIFCSVLCITRVVRVEGEA